ncbi:hypothetical protein R5R73_01315 [Salinicola sp. LHM]|uniref:hypothetical protein n=1 Tax=Salinicola sp. LHM TaxID=3065298 RepID=UPI002ACF0855|nr:hypothetical protein [Salinicola sp. LHM]WQH33366.1 hypothetical protein R5R73_01315 [Salinicola sp. LHM]
MATFPEKENAGFPEIYILEETDPVVGGPDGIDNKPHKQLAERDEHLRQRLVPLEKTAVEQEKRLQSVEISGSVSVGRAFPIWLAESDQGADFELFADAAYTWRDYAPAAIVSTVAGDESVDVATTNNLTVGDAYVIIDVGGTTEVVEVEKILTATRFRAAATLTKTRANSGTLARTSWDIRAGYALAGNGRYFSREIKTLRYDNAGRLIVRRVAGDGSVRVKARRTNAPATGWQNAPLKRSAATEDGYTDLEFRLPVGGTIELQLETQLGESGEPIEIHYLVCLPEVRAGRADAVRKPTNVAPAEGAVDVMETPALTGNVYYSLYGIAHRGAEFEVATDADFANIVYQGSEATAATQHTVASGILATDEVYFWRCRYQDAEGTWSPWSKPTGFSTGTVFEYVAPPVISSPATNATGVSLMPAIATAEFEAVGTNDAHVASQYQIATDSAFTAIAYDSGTVADLTSHRLATALARETRYYLRVRFQGETLGWSDWSVVRGFTTTNSANQPTITSPADGAADVDFGNGVTVSASSFSFPGGGEAHVASDWEIREADSGTVIASSTDDGANLTNWTAPGAELEGLNEYQVRVRYKGATTGYSPWSAWSAFTTGPAVGEAIFTIPGTFSWTVPGGVTLLSGLAIGGGGGAGDFSAGLPGGSSSIGSYLTAHGGQGGSNSSDGGDVSGGSGAGGSGGNGGSGGSGDAGYGTGTGGGGGAGGYAGDGGAGGPDDVDGTAGTGGAGGGGAGTVNYGGSAGGGGGVGLLGQGASGSGGTVSSDPLIQAGHGGSNGEDANDSVGGKYGGGAGGNRGGGGGGGGLRYLNDIAVVPGETITITVGAGGVAAEPPSQGAAGGQGAVRIIWGPGRSFPDNAA